MRAALLMLLLPTLALAAPRRLAVLELGNPAGVSEQEANLITDLVRGAAADLPGPGWFVMTRENIEALLPPGVDLADCLAAGKCEVEVGRAIGADFAVFGEIIAFGAQTRVSLKLYDVAGDGRLLGQEVAAAPAVEAVEDPVRRAARALFARLPGEARVTVGARRGAAGPAPAWAPQRAVAVTVESEPSGAVLRVDGREVGQTPWTDFVAPGPARLELIAPFHRGADVQIRFARPAAGGTQIIRLTLEPSFARLSVDTDPPGATVVLDGAPVGDAPWESGPLNPGVHRVEARLGGHDTATEQIRLVAGAPAHLKLRPTPRLGGLRVLARDLDGSALTARVEVDGAPRGHTPLTLKLLEGAHALRVVDPTGARLPHDERVEIHARETLDRALTLSPAGGTARRAGEEVERALRRHEPALQRCYRRALRADPSLGGSEKLLRFEIRPDGRVASLDLSPRHPALERCLRGLARGWRFPRSGGARIPVEWPLRLGAAP